MHEFAQALVLLNLASRFLAEHLCARVYVIKSHPTRSVRFFPSFRLIAGWLGATSWAVSMLATPVIIALCRRKSTRLTAVIGGLVLALGILFASFATQLHQVAFSYGKLFRRRIIFGLCKGVEYWAKPDLTNFWANLTIG